MDRGAGWATVHRVAKSQTRLNACTRAHTHTHTHTHTVVEPLSSEVILLGFTSCLCYLLFLIFLVSEFPHFQNSAQNNSTN